MMGIDSVPAFLRENYEIHEWKHAIAILQEDFPKEWQDIVDNLAVFRLLKSEILKPGGQKSEISDSLDSRFYQQGWMEKSVKTKLIVDSDEKEVHTHKVDCYRNGIAVEIEWNSKDSVFNRDLHNFMYLFDFEVLSVGVIITRSDELQGVFKDLGAGAKYGASTTHVSKLLPKIEGGGAGGCPVLVFGITKKLYVEDV